MTSPFSRTTLTIVIAVAVVSLAAAAVLTIFGDELGARRSAGVDGYSVSAIGHKGLVRLLEQLDVPVIVSRSASADKAKRGLLILAEPVVSDEASRQQLRQLAEGAPNVLLVLPKWFGSVERGQPWIADAHLLPLAEVHAVIDAVQPDNRLELERRPAPAAQLASAGGVAPVIRAPQVFSDDEDTAVLLLGLPPGDDTEIHLLSDPDVLNNVGLRHPENARYIVEVIDRLRHGGPVVIDETMHGYAQQPSLLRTLFRFPLVLATLQVLVCALLVVWAAMVRFGPRRAAPPPLAPGKDFLIRNTAALLHYGGHHAHALKRYLQLTVGAVRHALHAPALAPSAMTAWLERVRGVRGGTISLVELERAVETATTPDQVIALADQVFRWRMEMTHGTDHRS